VHARLPPSDGSKAERPPVLALGRAPASGAERLQRIARNRTQQTISPNDGAHLFAQQGPHRGIALATKHSSGSGADEPTLDASSRPVPSVAAVAPGKAVDPGRRGDLHRHCLASERRRLCPGFGEFRGSRGVDRGPAGRPLRPPDCSGLTAVGPRACHGALGSTRRASPAPPAAGLRYRPRAVAVRCRRPTGVATWAAAERDECFSASG
jgi:hypothetical protein